VRGHEEHRSTCSAHIGRLRHGCTAPRRRVRPDRGTHSAERRRVGAGVVETMTSSVRLVRDGRDDPRGRVTSRRRRPSIPGSRAGSWASCSTRSSRRAGASTCRSRRTGASGFEVSGFDSAEAALCSLDRSIPHVVVTDVTLPGIDGYELAARLKKDPRTRSIPIVAMRSSSSSRAGRRRSNCRSRSCPLVRASGRNKSKKER